MERKKLSAKSIPQCPQCNSKNTVGIVISYDNIKGNKASKCYFCSECLIEFDDRYINLYISPFI